MHSHDAVLHFAPTAAPLPLGPGRVRAALSHGRLVDHTQGLGMSVLVSDDSLAALTQSLLIPLDGFQKAL
jgi:hypothetical protein